MELRIKRMARHLIIGSLSVRGNMRPCINYEEVAVVVIFLSKC